LRREASGGDGRYRRRAGWVDECVARDNTSDTSDTSNTSNTSNTKTTNRIFLAALARLSLDESHTGY
jgi:hypothetical protein